MALRWILYLLPKFTMEYYDDNFFILTDKFTLQTFCFIVLNIFALHKYIKNIGQIKIVIKTNL
jgi:hypothetical protein